MQDKEVVQFTRNGVIKKDLSTGETKTMYQSDFAKEKRYGSVGQDSRYHSPYEHPKNGASEAHRSVYKQRRRQPSTEEKKGSPPLYSAYATKEEPVQGPGIPKTEGRTASGPDGGTFPYGNPNKGARYYYAAKDTGNQVYTHAEFRKRFRGPGSVKRRILHYSGDQLIHKSTDEGDNPGTQAVHSVFRSTSQIRSGILKIREHTHKENFVFRTTERTAVHASPEQYSYVRRKGVKRAASSAAKKAGSSGADVYRTGKTVQQAAGIIKHPAILKGLLIAGAISLGIMLFCMLINALLDGLMGGTIDHPDLTEYVEQLDSDFLAKIDGLKAGYEKAKDTTVTIEGDESVATDPNALSILATGEWTSVDLTPENKEKLAKCHDILNIYTVSTHDETKTETSTSPDGTTAEVQKTVHHITILVHVYTAMEKLDDFGFTAKQKDDISEQLTLLNGMTAGINGDTGGAGIVPGDGDFIWPLPAQYTYISSGYGSRVDPITGIAGAFHTGLDIPAPTGTPVVASEDGKVILAGVNGGYGNCIIIQHANGLQTLYGHNSELVVQKGETVTQGQVIAKVGQTGRATGPHCHFEFRINGQHVDPKPYIGKNQ